MPVETVSADLKRPGVRCVRRGKWRQFRSMRGWEWNHAILPVEGLPEALKGFRLIHLTDLHLQDHWPEGLDEILERIAALRADLILFTGDFVDSKVDHRPALPHLRRFVEGLGSRLGTYAVVGNHDGLALPAAMAQMPVTLITGRRVCLEDQGATIELIGLPGPYRYDMNEAFVHSMPEAPSEGVRVILSHFPGHWPMVAGLNPALFLAGHTHGGQICLPNRWPILRHDPMPRRLCSGINRIGRSWHVVGRGLGWSGLPLRVFCPSEVIEIELAAAR